MTAVLSPERVGRVTGSRLAGVLGISPYASREDVMREMVRQYFGAEPEFTGNPATDWGTEHEPHAIAAYEQHAGMLVHSGQQIVIHESGLLAATPDGLVGTDGCIETKCPYRAHYTHISERPDYESQCRLVMELTGSRWCDFVVWRPGGLHVSRVEHDPLWLPGIMPQIEAFLADYRTIIADENLARPHLEPLVDLRTDPDWTLAAVDWLDAKRAADLAAERAETARQQLITLAGDKPARGAGVHVIRSERKGSVAYARAIKDLAPGADLTPYAGEAKVVYSVRPTADGGK